MPNPLKKKRHRWNLFALMRQARKAAIAKGHSPGEWKIWPDNKGAIAQCTKCEMPFGCLTEPYVIETAVSGTALYYSCENKPWWGKDWKTYLKT